MVILNVGQNIKLKIIYDLHKEGVLMIYYHGTSFENYKLMLNGNKQIKKNWKESEDKMYF